MALILDGKKLQKEIAETLRGRIYRFSSAPKLVIVHIGARQESSAYIRQKKLFGESIGAEVEHIALPDSVSERELLSRIALVNSDGTVHGIIAQLPIPETLDRDRILDAIVPEKDVDGLGGVSVKRLWEGKTGFMPATAKGILTLLQRYDIPIEGRRALVVGRSSLVGKPTALALLNANATVTIAHSKTANLSALAREADILVAAVGRPRFIGRECVRQGQTVIDVGITAVTGEKLDNEITGRTLAGDVDFAAVKDIVGAISPVPGGIGPMTVASLFENLVTAYEHQRT